MALTTSYLKDFSRIPPLHAACKRQKAQFLGAEVAKGKLPRIPAVLRTCISSISYWFVNSRGSPLIKQVLIKTNKPQDLVL